MKYAIQYTVINFVNGSVFPKPWNFIIKIFRKAVTQIQPQIVHKFDTSLTFKNHPSTFYFLAADRKQCYYLLFFCRNIVFLIIQHEFEWIWNDCDNVEIELLQFLNVKEVEKCTVFDLWFLFLRPLSMEHTNWKQGSQV